MRKVKTLKVMLVAVPLLALLVSVGVFAGIGGNQNQDLSDVRPDPGGPDPEPCVCPHVYAPVICHNGVERKRFTNSCFAGCEGFVRCAPENNDLSIGTP